MIFYTAEEVFDKKIKKTVIAERVWYKNIHTVVLRSLKEYVRDSKGAYDISIVLVNDEKMKKLYAKYKGRNQVTDVLSFFYGKSEGDLRPQGDIFICLPQAVRQARRYHVSTVHEMARLTIHGFLHIYGYDHIKKGERTRMRSLECIIFRICKKENIF